MSLQFKKYVPEANTLTELGTVKAVVGKGGKLKPAGKKNFFNPEKRVALVLINPKGESAVVACSEQVSKHLRTLNKEGKTFEQLIPWIAGLNIMQNEEGVAFISMPSGGVGTEYSLDKVTVEDTADFIPEALVAF